MRRTWPPVLLVLLGCRGVGTNQGDVGPAPIVGPTTDTGDTGATTCAGPADADGDGWDATADGGSDCDDADTGVHPGTTDTADGVDDDCDGVDGAPADEACVPAGPETCDGVDQDCDGRIDDAFAAVVSDTATVALVAPILAGGAPGLVLGKVASTGDGAVSVYDADGTLVVRIAGTGQGTSFGQQIAAGRDLTGDGTADLVVAAPWATTEDGTNKGRVFVLPGPITASTTLEDAVFTYVGGELPGQVGTELGLAPDLTGDGLPELLIGYYRYVLLFSGAPTGEHRLADAYATWEVNTGGGAWHFATTPDVDGDGRDELVLGMSTYGAGAGWVTRWDSAGIGGRMGAASLTYDGGGWSGIGAKLTRVGDDLWTLAGTTPIRLGDEVEALDLEGTSLANGGDVDGDGVEDLLVETATGVEAPGIGVWGGDATLQHARDLAPAADLDGDGAPDPVVLLAEDVAALDGGVAFGGSCDGDADGVPSATDCDDGRADVAPLARELCDGADNDCDGEIDAPAEEPLATRATFVSALGDGSIATLGAEGLVTVYPREVTTAVSVSAYPFAGVGDTDGDGVAELLTNTAEGVELGPVGTRMTTFGDGTAWRHEGRVGHAGDFDGDGLSDVWLGVRAVDDSYGIAVATGPFAELEDVGNTGTLLTTPPTWDTFTVAGARAGGTADVDGDGRDDLLVGNPRSAYGDGRAYLFLGGISGERSMDTSGILLLYGETGEQMGTTLAMGGDIDGDGVDDALIGGTTGVRVLQGAACPLFAPRRYAVGAEALALVDMDDDGRAEAWLYDAYGALYRGVGDELEEVRTGTLAEPLNGGMWAIGAGELVYDTSVESVRMGVGCE